MKVNASITGHGSVPCSPSASWSVFGVHLISDHRRMTSPSEFTAAHAAFVAGAFDLGEVVQFTGPTDRGQLGFVFCLTTSRGRWAVKRLIDPQSEEDVCEDVAFVAAARVAGVPAPAIVTTRAGAVLLDLPEAGPPGAARGQVRVSQWVDLTAVDPYLDAAAVGGAVGALHRTQFRGSRGEDAWYRAAIGADRWDELVVDLADARAPFADDVARLRDEFVSLEGTLVDPHDLRTCHRDLFPENLRGVADGAVCVIDWDNHGLAGASQELAFVLWGFAGGRAGRARTMVESYIDAGGSGRVQSPGDFTMLVATLAHINERACAQWLAHRPGDPERARMAALFQETVADPLTHSAISDLLDAVG